jgi:hypothetical protein
MIPVEKASEPVNFDECVRQPGLEAIAEMVGERPTTLRPGPKREKKALTRDQIVAKDFPPFWRDVLPDMLVSYNRLCSYLALYIEYATGSPSVDHVLPKSKSWDKVYEWSNYRLACALVNSKKSNVDFVLDPFEIEDGLFALEFFAYEVKLGARAVGELEVKAADTIEKLGLNMRDCCQARQEYVENYKNAHIKLEYLERRAPFIAQELRRQGQLNAGDV